MDVEACAARGYAVDIGRLIRGVTSVAGALCDGAGRPRLVVAAHLFQGQLSEDGLDRLGHALAALVQEAQPALFGATRPPRPRRRRRSPR